MEAYFEHLNRNYAQLCSNWSGWGITTSPSRQPNGDAVNMLKKQFPEMEGLFAQIDRMMEIERRLKVDEMRRLYADLPAEYRLPLDRELYLMTFGESTGRRNALEGKGVCPTIDGVKHFYDSFDIKFREHAGVRWEVKYDPDDLSTALAVNEDGTLRFMLEEKYVQPMALADRRPGDARELQRIFEFNDRIEEHVRGKIARAYELTDGLFDDADLQLLNRFPITDSHGQHKLPQAAERLGKDVDGNVKIIGWDKRKRDQKKDEYADSPYSIF